MSLYQISLLAAAALVLIFPSINTLARRAYDWFRARGGGQGDSDCHTVSEVFDIAVDLRSHLAHSHEAVDAIDRIVIPAIVTMLDGEE